MISQRHSMLYSSSHLRRCPVTVSRNIIVVRASPGTEQKPPAAPPPPQKDDKKTADPKLEFVLKEFKRTGMDASQARKILSAWEKAGVTDPETLRKLLVKKTLPSVTGPLLQAMVDASICFGGFYISTLASVDENFPSRILFMLAGNAIGLYYLLQITLELSLAAASAYASYKYGTSAPELLAAIKQLAGSTGLNLADKASSIVNMVRVLQALEEVSKLMQAQFGDAGTPTTGNAKDSLRNLTALLTLARAKEQLGFEPEKYGLTEAKAANIAMAFAQFDSNDNGRLEMSEVGNLCSSLGWNLDAAELKEAYNTLDSDKNGVVDFNEFVDWWCLRCPIDKRSKD